ncbi:LysR family transcriptional regulator [Serratia rubidaea]|uniref:LysR family transcriptional regulator n=1 Tax=Serratia rubidaea TaxID=61652 RepID=UPI00242FD06E|nr:LysR family transcriptional regulator [Serratia rubidaea]MCR0998086.1 LysR family transcriptional regulator [Serratia rubidaea]
MNFEGFDLNLLAAFNALMTERNVTKAAAMAGVSQPAMSAALARLRRVFDDPLFIRSAEGLLPTAKAQGIAPPVAEALARIRSVMQPAETFDPAAQALSFTLGLTEYPLHIMLPALSKAFAAQAPHGTLHIRAFTDRDETVALLDSGKIDVALSVTPSKTQSRILSVPLLSDEFVTLTGKNGDAAPGEMPLQRFVAMKHILASPEGNRYGLVDEMLRARGLSRQVALTLPGMFAIPALLPGTDYVSTLLRRAATGAACRDALLSYPPPLTMPPIEFHLLWHQRTQEPAAHRWLRTMIAAACREIE